MDPGNWATDIAAGAQFGYLLLFAVLLSSITAMFLQHLALKLGAATGRDLAQACRDSFRRWIVIMLWLMMEVAITATDLAEVRSL
jgi:manganese transport protein